MRKLGEKIVVVVPLRYQNSAWQFLKFGVTGVIGAVVDFGTYFILTRLVGWDTIFYPLGYEIIAANLVSVTLAISSNFILNKYWTFRNTDRDVVKQWSGYFAMNAVTFVLNQILTSFFAFRVPIIASIFGSRKDYVAKALAIGLILFVNFLGSKLLIFKRKAPVNPYQNIRA